MRSASSACTMGISRGRPPPTALDFWRIHWRSNVTSGSPRSPWKRGDAQGALVEYETILARHPNWTPGHLGRAWALERLGRTDEARAAQDRAARARSAERERNDDLAPSAPVKAATSRAVRPKSVAPRLPSPRRYRGNEQVVGRAGARRAVALWQSGFLRAPTRERGFRLARGACIDVA